MKQISEIKNYNDNVIRQLDDMMKFVESLCAQFKQRYYDYVMMDHIKNYECMDIIVGGMKTLAMSTNDVMCKMCDIMASHEQVVFRMLADCFDDPILGMHIVNAYIKSIREFVDRKSNGSDELSADLNDIINAVDIFVGYVR